MTAGDLPWWQPISAGTTAWRKSMGRRHSVEGVNTMIKGGFVNIERKFMRVFGRSKMTIVLAFTIAGFNRDRIHSFMERVATQITKKATRGKRRRNTWHDLLGASPLQSAGHDPPQADADDR